MNYTPPSGYKRFCNLIMVNADNNNNKFYHLYENNDYSVEAYWGRVGAVNVAHKHYESWEKNFDQIVREKERKGYEDRTALVSEIKKNDKVKDEMSYKPIGEEETREMIELLINESREFMKNNYEIEAVDITQKMIDEADYDIQQLIDIAEKVKANSSYDDYNNYALRAFNKRLTTLFTDIPRDMNKVKECVAKSIDDFEDIIEREQQMLDNIRGQIVKTVVEDKDDKDITVLEAHGLTARPVTFKEEDEIIAHLGKDYDGTSVERRYVKAFAVENKQTRESYEKFKQDHNVRSRDVKLFYHGSKVENWYSIIKQGLSLNPNARVTGKMFGNGIYFASDCRKSLNYMDTKYSHWNDGKRETGYTAVYAVALGKCYEPTTSLRSSFSKKDLPKGCCSVYADKRKTGLHNDEYIIYDESQCTLKYLVEFTHKAVKELEFNLDRRLLRNEIGLAFEGLKSLGKGIIETILDLEALSPAAKNEMEKFFPNKDYEICVVYTPDRGKGKIEFFGNGKMGDRITFSPNFTNNDKAFLMREMKKAFCDSELEWKEIVKVAEKTKKNEQIKFDKDDKSGKEKER